MPGYRMSLCSSVVSLGQPGAAATSVAEYYFHDWLICLPTWLSFEEKNAVPRRQGTVLELDGVWGELVEKLLPTLPGDSQSSLFMCRNMFLPTHFFPHICLQFPLFLFPLTLARPRALLMVIVNHIVL